MPSSSSNKTSSTDGVVKHRACDECRSRKLACSKETDGCSRCKREAIRCVYSPQKPMGRPRKQRNGEESGSKSKSHSKHNSSSSHQGGYSKDLALETDFSFLEADDCNLEFLDLLTPSYGHPPTLVQSMVPVDPALDDYSQYSHAQIQFGALDILGGASMEEPDEGYGMSRYMGHQAAVSYNLQYY